MRRNLALVAVLGTSLAALVVANGCGGNSSDEATSSSAPAGSSHIARLEITSKVSPAFAGTAFGSAGAYELLVGKLHGEADPNSPINGDVTDLRGAPVNAAGRVEYTADVVILKPIDMSKSDGTLTYEVVNRGNKLAAAEGLFLGTGNFTSAAGAGQGGALDQGGVFVWSGWEADIPSTMNANGGGVMAAQLPIAKRPDGSSITGTVIDEVEVDGSAAAMIPAIPTTATSFDVPLSYTPAQADPTKLKLTVQAHGDDVPVVLPSSQMAFIGPATLRVQLAPGFNLGAIYKVTYVATDPVVAGLGLAGIRDLVSFLRFADKDDAGNANPLALNGKSAVQHTIGIGYSQSGRFLKDFVYHDFNRDEQNRKVLDGVLPTLSGAKMGFNTQRFAQPNRSPDWSHLYRGYPGAQFPFTYGTFSDPVTGTTDGILRRCSQSDTCPKVIHMDTETEQWHSFGSLVVTDPVGQPIVLPDNVRAYVVGGTQHGGGGGIAQGTFGKNPLICDSGPNNDPLGWQPVHIALYMDMRDWLSNGTLPPDSRDPAGTSQGRLPIDSLANVYPSIPGAPFSKVYSHPQPMDFSGDIWKPLATALAYAVSFLPVDGNGNAQGGIVLPEISVPIATYSGRVTRAPGYGSPDLCETQGSSIPFPKTAAERTATGDPRLSIAERYVSVDDYRTRLKAAADILVQQRLMLAQDAARYTTYLLPN